MYDRYPREREGDDLPVNIVMDFYAQHVVSLGQYRTTIASERVHFSEIYISIFLLPASVVLP